MTSFNPRGLADAVWRAVNRRSVGASAPTGTLRPYHQDRRRRYWWWSVAFASLCTIYGFAFALFAPNLMGLLAAPVAILAAVVIWALPDIRNAPAGLIEPLFFAYFAALVLWPNYLAIALPGLPWITLNRLIQFPLAALTLICLSASREFRSQLAQILQSASAIWIMIALFVANQVVTLLFSTQFGFSLQTIVNYQLNCTLVFFVGCYVFNKPGRIRRWFFLEWAAVVGVCIIGVLEQREGRPPWADHIPGFLHVNDPLIAAILKGGSRGGIHRVQATYGTSLTFAEYLALAAPFVIDFAMTGRRLFVRLAAVATLPLIMFVILLTGSRLGVIGVLLGSLTYLMFWAASLWRRDRKSILGPAVSLAYPLILLLAVASTLFVGRLRAVVFGNGPQSESNASRAAEWAAAIPKVLHNPIGYGAGTGGAVLGFVDVDGVTIDSFYISIILEYGIIGFVLYYGVICYAIGRSAKLAVAERTRDLEEVHLAPIAASMVSYLFTRSVLSEIDNVPFIFALMGMVVALIHRSRESASVAMRTKATYPVSSLTA